MTTVSKFDFFPVPVCMKVHTFKNSGNHDGKSGWAIAWLWFIIRYSKP